MTLLGGSATSHVVPTHSLQHRSHMEARVRHVNDLHTIAVLMMRSCVVSHRQPQGDCDRLDAYAAMLVPTFTAAAPLTVFTINISDVAKVRVSSRPNIQKHRRHLVCSEHANSAHLKVDSGKLFKFDTAQKAGPGDADSVGRKRWT
jgi:hypothetical protein